jgi:dGTP triphosphohydrolase
MIPGMTAPSLVATCHPKHHQIKRPIAYFHNINSHFAKLQIDLGNGEYADKEILLHCIDCDVAAVAKTATERVPVLYKERRKVELETGSFFIIDTLLNASLDACFEWLDHQDSSSATSNDEDILSEISPRARHILDVMGDERPTCSNGHVENFRRCIDFIGGMTDEFATYLAKQIHGAGQ